MTTAAIEVQSLVKSFGPRTALAGVDLQVGAGQFVVLVGPNGAGKTTLLRVLAALTRPTSGTVRVAGQDLSRAGGRGRREIGFLSHRTLLYDDLTAEENLRFYARLYDLLDGPARVDELLYQVDLVERRHDLVRTYSRGMQQRLAVARAVLHRPAVLLLDEPYTGLDLRAAQALTDRLVELGGSGCTILLTTHDLERGLQAGSRVVVLARGKVVVDVARGEVDLTAFPEMYGRLTA